MHRFSLAGLHFFLALLVFVLLGSAPASAQQTPAPRLFCLDSTHGFKVKISESDTTGAIYREMARQAFLLAARHELGLVTRDGTIEDTTPMDGAPPAYELAFELGQPNKVTVLSGPASPRKPVGSLNWDTNGVTRYRLLFAGWEEKSRTEIPQLLREAGLSGQPLAWKPDAPTSDEIEALLQDMTLFAQFRAAQKLHALVRTDGESPARLAALTRCYAHLAMLTEVHWTQERYAYWARAILYGQRLAVKQPDSAFALWHRAYAFSLTGTHKSSFEDFAAAEKAADFAQQTMPYWIEAAKHNLYCDLDALAKLEAREAKSAQLCGLLRYDMVEQACSANHTVAVAIELLPKMPECFRIHDGLSTFGGVGILHGATAQTPQMFAQLLYTRLQEFENLPPAVQKRVKEGTSGGGILNDLFGGEPAPDKEFKLRNRLLKALRAAADGVPASPAEDAKPPKAADEPAAAGATIVYQEPSWGVLAKLIHEASFLHAMRRVTFEADMLGVDPEASIEYFRSLLVDHPNRWFLDAHSWDSEVKEKAIKKLQAALQKDAVEIHARPLIDAVWSVDQPAANELYAAAWDHQGNAMFDLGVRHRLSPRSDPGILDTARDGMPYAPLGRMLQIRDQWDSVKEQAAAWEKDGQSWPLVMRAFGQRYVEEKQWDAAERCLKRAVEIDPSRDNYTSLADMYWDHGEKDRWVTTLEEYLDKPDYGLGHAQVRVRIADVYSYEREWEKAAPYADEAAETWAGWAMQTAGCVREGLEEFETAEQWFANLSERYRGSALQWYFFCRRTGKGRLDEAMQLAESASVERGTLDNTDLATFLVLSDQPAEAVDLFLSGFERWEWHADYGLSAAFAAHAAGDYKRRDEILQMVKEKSPSYVVAGPNTPRTDLLGLTDMMIAGFDGEKAKPLDIAAVEKLPFERNEIAEISFRYFVGKYEMIAGEKDEAIRQFKIAVASPEPADNERTLAAVELRTLGVAPEDYLGLLRTGFPPKEDEADAAK
jgi:tetratricopeptide (TPR) repeat protein